MGKENQSNLHNGLQQLFVNKGRLRLAQLEIYGAQDHHAQTCKPSQKLLFLIPVPKTNKQKNLVN